MITQKLALVAQEILTLYLGSIYATDTPTLCFIPIHNLYDSCLPLRTFTNRHKGINTPQLMSLNKTYRFHWSRIQIVFVCTNSHILKHKT
jgi:hypothetical protein